mmetsp:Transcript_10128/g.16771  ORF Transcript_10128/g.16771 Transcript_10128/m.16771 type:complete len:504 (+) Transcript_10128:135-1646(+)|eukprot:CAMPEP_0114418364 /NCGR_PEP_ID=MMETSP0103-20121206/3456_1 /TAXON_ID=37642 ORGANISM="Paraphysomonas imperforata, Strain PA2" /NCGR_SAMPLE_ID=MMETSP0103 /ASSEMBLY_ACC=CAM_ASM_000201 /LENGTH=503 /DNA_ID=CAMNT_0001586715 /DNA_START=76 /DNA_END=1587 /DNA_ORIENTATION=-
MSAKKSPSKRKLAGVSSPSTKKKLVPTHNKGELVEVRVTNGGARVLEPVQWVDLGVPPGEMRPSFTLATGQVFHWQQLAGDLWVGVLGPYALAVREDQSTSYFALLGTGMTGISECNTTHERENEKLLSLLRSYFQLGENFSDLFELWSSRCGRMKAVAAALPGVRVLRQEPWECLASFIFSANNNIPRITKGLQSLRQQYGHYICSVVLVPPSEISSDLSERFGLGEVEFQQRVVWEVTALSDSSVVVQPPVSTPLAAPTVSKTPNTSDVPDSASPSSYSNTSPKQSSPAQSALSPLPPSPLDRLDLFSFPSPEQLLEEGSESQLRALGFGYRARYLIETAELVQQRGGLDWLQGLRSLPRQEVRAQLILMSGVGPKVADCVALFSLDQPDVVPVDTHVRDICMRDYAKNTDDSTSPHARIANAGSLTPSIYEAVGDVFRERFQRRAGWAHSVLFAGELPFFKTLLPQDLQEDMAAFARLQKLSKQNNKKSSARPSPEAKNS